MKSIVSVTWLVALALSTQVLAEPKVAERLDARKATAVSLGEFGFTLFSALKKEQPKEQIAVSPLSIGEAVTLATVGAEKETLKELEAALISATLRKNGANVGMLEVGLKSLRQDLANFAKASNGAFEFSSANSLWANSNPRIKFEFAPKFLDRAKTNFGAELRALDFAELVREGENKGKQRAVVEVNGWVDTKTNHKISKLLEKLGAEDVAVILNAVYTKGKFKEHFSKLSEGSYLDARGDESKEPVSYMTKTEAMGHNDSGAAAEVFSFAVEEARATSAEATQQIALDILVPKKGTVATLAKSLDYKTYSGLVAGLKTRKVELTLPAGKVEAKESLTLKSVLKSKPFALTRSFEESLAQFGPLGKVRQETNIFINDILTKTFYETSPFGFEAAAATAVVFATRTSVRPEPEKPLQRTIRSAALHVVRHVPTGLPLFIVEYDSPKLYTTDEIVDLVVEGHKHKRPLRASTKDGEILVGFDETSKQPAVALFSKDGELKKILRKLGND